MGCWCGPVVFLFLLNWERLRAEMVTWPSASCRVCGPAARLLPVRRCAEERKRNTVERRRGGATGRGLDDAELQALLTRRREAEKKEGEADMQATEESGNTPTSVT